MNEQTQTFIIAIISAIIGMLTSKIPVVSNFFDYMLKRNEQEIKQKQEEEKPLRELIETLNAEVSNLKTQVDAKDKITNTLKDEVFELKIVIAKLITFVNTVGLDAKLKETLQEILNVESITKDTNNIVHKQFDKKNQRKVKK